MKPYNLLGNEESSIKNWKRNPDNSPVPKTPMYAVTANIENKSQ
jgi:hypothetical protein